MQGSSIGAAQLGDQLGTLMGQAGTVLSGIDSVDEAREALAGLQSVDQGLGQLVQAAGNLSTDQAGQLAAKFSDLAPQLERAVAHAYDVPGAREVLSNSVDSILRKLQTIADG